MKEVLSPKAYAAMEKTIKEGGKTETSRITYAFRRALARPPQPAEIAELRGFLNKQLDRKLPADQAWMALARVILNLDETITKE